MLHLGWILISDSKEKKRKALNDDEFCFLQTLTAHKVFQNVHMQPYTLRFVDKVK